MSATTRYIKCGNPACSNMRAQGGKTRPDGLCKHCVKMAWNRTLQGAKLADKAGRKPTESWWLRKDFSAAAREQESRLRAQGVGRPQEVLE